MKTFRAFAEKRQAVARRWPLERRRNTWRWVSNIGLLFVGLLLTLMGLVLANRHRLIEAVEATINSRINGSFSAHDVHVSFWRDAPGVTFVFTDVHLQDARYARYRTEFLAVEEATVRVSLWSLFRRDLDIRAIGLRNGRLRLFRTARGYQNYMLFNRFRPDSGAATGQPLHERKFTLRQLRLEHIEVSYADSLRQKRFGAVFQDAAIRAEYQQETGLKAHLSGQVWWHGLGFRPSQGYYLGNKASVVNLEATYLPATRKLLVLPSTVTFFGNKTIQLQGGFQFFAGRKRPPLMHLRLSTGGIRLYELLRLLPVSTVRKIIKFRSNPYVEQASVLLTGVAGPGHQPGLTIAFRCDSAQYVSRLGLISHIRTEGFFTNRSRRSPRPDFGDSRLFFDIKRAYWESAVPLSGQLFVHDFSRARGLLNLSSNTPLDAVSQYLDDPAYRFQNGTIIARMSYTGYMKPFVDSLSGRLRGRLQGHVHLNGGEFDYLPQRLHFDSLHANLDFDHNNLQVHRLEARLRQSPITLSGQVQQLIPFLMTDRQKLTGYAVLTSPHLNLTGVRFTPSHQKRTLHRRQRGIVREKVVRSIRRIFDRLETDFRVNIDRFEYRQLSISQLNGQLTVTNRDMRLRNLQGRAFGGALQVQGGLDRLSNHNSRLQAAFRISNADVQQVFRSFENFGQKTMTDRSLRGTWTSEATLGATLYRDYRFVPGSISGQAHIRLQNGVIRDFEPLKRIQKVVLKRRDFSNVTFSTIDTRLKIRGYDIDVARTAIESSVLSLYLSGVYSFQDRTNFNVQIPFANFKRRSAADNARLDLGPDQKGWDLNLRVRDVGGEMTFDLNLGGGQQGRLQRKQARRARREARRNQNQPGP